GDDWLALGITQLQQEKWDKAEATLKGAQNLLPKNPFPTLHLAKVYQGQKNAAKERETIEAAIQLEPNAVDAWAYLYSQVRQAESEDEALKFAKLAVSRNENDPLALICLSALYGQAGDLDSIINLLAKHESKMTSD